MGGNCRVVFEVEVVDVKGGGKGDGKGEGDGKGGDCGKK